MAGWWIPLPQLLALRKIAEGKAEMKRTPRNSAYWWNDGGGCSPTRRALANKGLIAPMTDWCSLANAEVMRITPTGQNTLTSHRTLTPEHYKK